MNDPQPDTKLEIPDRAGSNAVTPSTAFRPKPKRKKPLG